MTASGPQVAEQTVVLVDDEVSRARKAVRRYLSRIRAQYGRELRAGDAHAHYAATTLRRFDDYLDLYERLGGDPDEVRDVEAGDVR